MRGEEGGIQKELCGGNYRAQDFFSYPTASLLTLHPIKAPFTWTKISHPQLEKQTSPWIPFYPFLSPDPTNALSKIGI